MVVNKAVTLLTNKMEMLQNKMQQTFQPSVALQHFPPPSPSPCNFSPSPSFISSPTLPLPDVFTYTPYIPGPSLQDPTSIPGPSWGPGQDSTVLSGLEIISVKTLQHYSACIACKAKVCHIKNGTRFVQQMFNVHTITQAQNITGRSGTLWRIVYSYTF